MGVRAWHEYFVETDGTGRVAVTVIAPSGARAKSHLSADADADVVGSMGTLIGKAIDGLVELLGERE